jgi:hypothetical protein
MVIDKLTLEDVLQDVTRYKAAYYNILSFKYQLNHVGRLSVSDQIPSKID